MYYMIDETNYLLWQTNTQTNKHTLRFLESFDTKVSQDWKYNFVRIFTLNFTLSSGRILCSSVDLISAQIVGCHVLLICPWMICLLRRNHSMIKIFLMLLTLLICKLKFCCLFCYFVCMYCTCIYIKHEA